MKGKAFIIIAVAAAIGVAAASAWAGPWGQGRGGRGAGGPGYCANNQPQSQAYLDETADLRDELAAKRGEYQALMSSDNPDPERASRLQREMSQIREQLRDKAAEYQDGYTGRYGDSNYGPRGGRGNPRGPCW